MLIFLFQSRTLLKDKNTNWGLRETEEDDQEQQNIVQDQENEDYVESSECGEEVQESWVEGHQYSTKDQELEPEYQEQEEDGQEQDEPLLEELQELHNGSRIGNDDSVDTMRDLENIGRTLLPSPRVMETLVNEGTFEDEVIDKVYNESDHTYCANLEDTNISDHSYGKNDKQGKVSKPFGGRGGLF